MGVNFRLQMSHLMTYQLEVTIALLRVSLYSYAFYRRFTSSRQRTPDMGYPEPTTITNDEFWSILDKLGLLLRDIPKELPDGGTTSTHYGTFINFHLDEELLDKTGDEVSTLGEQLECIFGWKARTSGDGTLPILEHGKSIQALHSIFSTFYQKFPENNVLKKWVIDVCIGLEKVYEQYHKEISATTIYIMTSLMRVQDSQWLRLWQRKETGVFLEHWLGDTYSEEEESLPAAEKTTRTVTVKVRDMDRSKIWARCMV